MKKIILLLSLLVFLLTTGIASAQEQIADYFYPEGNSSYYVYKDNRDDASPVEKFNVRYERTNQGARLEEDPPIPLIGNITYSRPLEMVCYLLDISNSTVTARTRWTQQKTSNKETPTPGDNVYHDLVLLKLPADKETVTWTTTLYKDGAIQQVWEMSAKRKLMPAKVNGSWIAVHALEVKRNVFDANHNPVPKANITEYWQKGKGKVKVVWNK